MSNWVIEPLLDESHIEILHDAGLLKSLALCSRSVVLDNIVSYLDSDGDENIKQMLREAYTDRLSTVDILNSAEVRDKVELVRGYNFYSVKPSMSIEELEEMKANIEEVCLNESNIPYVNPIKGDMISEIINNLLALYSVNKDKRYKLLCYILTKNKELFKDKPNAHAKGTVFKATSKRISEYKIILRGIDFMIRQISSGHKPESWRIF